MACVLLIDGGQTGCRVALVRDGVRVAEASGRGLTRTARDLGVLREAVAALGADGVDVVAAGLTGFDQRAELAAAVRDAVPAPLVLVTDDAVTSYLGALGPVPGAVVAAGTGAIALAAGEDGRWARTDGWGTMLGDDGGGYWIGRRGLALALRARDGRGGSDELLRRAGARLGTDIVAAVYDAPDPVAVVAGFAAEVADAARDGDGTAAAIWREAGHELARSVAAALGRVFEPAALGVAPGEVARTPGSDARARPLAVAWVGGLFAAGDLLLGPFTAELARIAPAAVVRPPLGSSLDGAARLVERSPLLSSLVHVLEAGVPPP